jgi:Spy/CpxP family protein refolding chaperone
MKTRNERLASWKRLAAAAVMGLISVVLLSFISEVRVNARQQGMRRRDQLTPGDRRDPGPGRRPNRPGNGGFVEPLTQQDRRDMRLVPPGVAFPRVLVRVFRQLDLSESQRSQLEHFATRSGNQMPALHRLRKAQSELLDEALYGENFDAKLVDQRANDLAGTQAEIIKLQARMMTQIRQVLTPDQSVKFRDLLSRERSRQEQPPPPGGPPIGF